MAVSKVLKLEGAVIHIPENIENKMMFLVGDPNKVSNDPVAVFDESRLNFLADLSSSLLKMPIISDLPDVATFAFWCRKGNLIKVSAKNDNARLRLGLGLVFHISPSNVPVNFAFSLVFAFLAGNSSVVRLPSKESASASVIINVILSLLEKSQYRYLIPFIHLIKFDRDVEVNQFWALTADARVVWGGDKTVTYMRSLESKPRSREVAFADRYSICTINAYEIIDLSSSELDTLCKNLFNDVYIMDQNTCSSPQLFVWIGSIENVGLAKDKLWPAFVEYTKKKYVFEPIHVMDKYVGLCRNILTNNNIKNVKTNKNITYNVELNKTQKKQHYQRGYFGTIHEVRLGSLDDAAKVIDEHCQTLTYYGFDKKEIYKFVINNHLRGIDRIVPVGQSLEMGIIWDGYNTVESLSRIVDIQ